MSYAKLDMYDYELYFPGDHIIVDIKVSSANDVDVADIATDITANNGKIYVEGYRLCYQDMRIKVGGGNWYLELITKEESKCQKN